MGCLKLINRVVIAKLEIIFILNEKGLEAYLCSYWKILKKLAKTEIQASFKDKRRQYRDSSFTTYYKSYKPGQALWNPLKKALEVPVLILNSLYFEGMLNNPDSFIILGIVEDSVWYKGQGLINKPRLSSKSTIRALAKEFKSAKYV
jgi:hypothetical protein